MHGVMRLLATLACACSRHAEQHGPRHGSISCAAPISRGTRPATVVKADEGACRHEVQAGPDLSCRAGRQLAGGMVAFSNNTPPFICYGRGRRASAQRAGGGPAGAGLVRRHVKRQHSSAEKACHEAWAWSDAGMAARGQRRTARCIHTPCVPGPLSTHRRPEAAAADSRGHLAIARNMSTALGGNKVLIPVELRDRGFNFTRPAAVTYIQPRSRTYSRGHVHIQRRYKIQDKSTKAQGPQSATGMGQPLPIRCRCASWPAAWTLTAAVSPAHAALPPLPRRSSSSSSLVMTATRAAKPRSARASPASTPARDASSTRARHTRGSAAGAGGRPMLWPQKSRAAAAASASWARGPRNRRGAFGLLLPGVSCSPVS
jgi:hypothetical protein